MLGQGSHAACAGSITIEEFEYNFSLSGLGSKLPLAFV